MDNSQPMPVPPSSEIPNQPSPPISPLSPQLPKPPFLFILGGLILLIVGTIGILYLGIKWQNKSKPVACTQEAKICPDGSSVSRTGPNCDFAPCPPVTTSSSPTPGPTTGWKIYSNKDLGVNFMYPPDWNVDLVNGINLNIGPDAGSTDKPPVEIIGYPVTTEDFSLMKETYVTNSLQNVTQKTIKKPEYELMEYTIEFSSQLPRGGKTTIVYLISNKDRHFLLQLADLNYKEIFDQILSSFKFLD